MVTRETKPYEHIHPDGVVTNYEVETIKRDGAAPIFIVRNSPDNKGYGFNSNQPLNEHLTEKHAIKAREQFKLKPPQIEWYEERKDGDYSKIKFGFTPSGTTNTEKHEQQWGEMSEKGGRSVVYTKLQVDTNVAKYISLDKGEQQKLAEETNLSKQSIPEKTIDRAAEQRLYEQQKKQEPGF
jgi:hypothetical protein